MCFGFRFTVVMYRGHILAEWENIFDIDDIDGNRREGPGLLLPPISLPNNMKPLAFRRLCCSQFTSGSHILSPAQKVQRAMTSMQLKQVLGSAKQRSEHYFLMGDES
jgi:hypothetical protein